MKRIAVILAGALLPVVAVQLSMGQVRLTDQTPTFRVRTDVVQLDVSVLDRQGQPVRGLTAGDFTVLADGLPQPIVAFAAVDVPAWAAGTAAWTREVGPDVLSNRLDARRAVVIVMDDFTRTPVADPLIPLARSIATAAIDGLGPADLAAVVHVLNRHRGQEFTLDRTRLRAAVGRFVPSGETLPETRGRRADDSESWFLIEDRVPVAPDVPARQCGAVGALPVGASPVPLRPGTA